MVPPLRAIAAALFAWLLCAAPAAEAQRFRVPEPAGTVDAGSFEFSTLPPQRLERGQCGMFLWAQTPHQPVFVLAAFDNPAEVRVSIDKRERNLPRTAFEGERMAGHFERQTYSDGRVTMRIEVQFDEEREIRGGAMVRQGVLRVTDREGWETIIPVGGMIGCQG